MDEAVCREPIEGLSQNLDHTMDAQARTTESERDDGQNNAHYHPHLLLSGPL